MKRLLLTSSFLLTGFAVAGGGPAPAAAQEAGSESFCTASYSPGDSQASGGQRAAQAASEFAEMDTNGDGMVSQAEYIDCKNAAAGAESAEADRSPENMGMADADADRAVSLEEFLAAAEGARAQAAKAESASSEQALIMRRYVFIPVTAPDTDVRSMSGPETEARAARQFHSLDSNDDDKLSEEEWSQRSAAVPDRADTFAADFEEIDADRSGTLSESEYTEALRGDGVKEQGDQTDQQS